MPTIVSITPLPVEKDSRTYKQAAAISRFGFNSVVIESESSGLDVKSLPFILISPSCLKKVLPKPNPTEAKRILKVEGVLQKIYDTKIVKLLLMPLYILYYFLRYDLPVLLNAPRANLYYLHSPIMFLSTYMLSRLHRVRYIYDAHDFYSQMREGAANKVMTAYWNWIEKLCISKSAELVTVSDGLGRLYPEHFDKEAKVLRNLHDHRIDKPSGKSIRLLEGMAADSFVIVSAGHCKRGQAFDVLLKALAELPSNVRLVTVGNGYADFASLAKEVNVENRVHFLPPVKPFEVVPLIREADLGIVLSFEYSENYLHSLPNKFFQYIAAGIPILYPPLPEIAAIAEKYDLGLKIDPRSKDSLKEMVIKMLEKRDLYLRYKANAEKAGGLLTWENEEEILHELILEHC